MRILMRTKMLRSGFFCLKCNIKMDLVGYTDVKDNYCWRCMDKGCCNYRSRKNLTYESFFEGLGPSFLKVIKLLIRWSGNVSQHSILENLRLNTKTFRKIINKFLNILGGFDFKDDKLSEDGKIFQIDETRLSSKVKAHRGRSLLYNINVLCIFEDHITKAFASVIENKKAETIIPIITDNVPKIARFGPISIRAIRN